MAEPFQTDLSQYAQLRTIIDSLQIGALRYYLNATSQAERQENFNYLQTQLTPITNHIWARSAVPVPSDCPDGTNDCDGYCVSWPCQN